ncbi:hypothetical protein BSKO_03393 [Bryopsis sp. KO-2023]|nr:hypothetical protein BSKO_03393 [Bryopsis sp. KO-2023]
MSAPVPGSVSTALDVLYQTCASELISLRAEKEVLVKRVAELEAELVSTRREAQRVAQSAARKYGQERETKLAGGIRNAVQELQSTLADLGLSETPPTNRPRLRRRNPFIEDEAEVDEREEEEINDDMEGEERDEELFDQGQDETESEDLFPDDDEPPKEAAGASATRAEVVPGPTCIA